MNIIFDNVAGPGYHARVMSKVLHVILKQSLTMISHVIKDLFSFKNRLDMQS